MRPAIDWFALLPELVLLGAAGICLMAAIVGPRALRTPVAAAIAALGFVGAFISAVLIYEATPGGGEGAIVNAIERDRYGAFAQFVVAGIGLLAVAVSHGDRRERQHGPEYYALLATAGAGMCFFVTAT